jgi:Kef-type K+ transport system membrane component KefB
MHGFLTDIAIAIIVSGLLGLIAHWSRQPLVIAYLLAGVVIGPAIGPSLVENPQTIDTISELGLILLLFTIGLEINPASLRDSGKSIAVSGIGQVLLTVPLGIIFFSLVGPSGSLIELTYLGVLCAMSSTAIVVKFLHDKFELDTLPGKISLGVLIFQDLWAIFFLVLQPTLTDPRLDLIILALAKSSGLVLVGFLASRYLLRPVFATIARSPELVVATSLGWCAAMSGLAGMLGVSKEMGALIAGVSLSAFPYSMHVTAKVLPLRDFFLTLFFVALGMRIPAPDPVLFATAGIITIFAIASRFAVLYPLVRMAGGSDRTGFIASLNLSQISEFSLVIAALGVQYGHIPQKLFSAVLYAMAVTSMISPYAITYSRQLYNLGNTLLRRHAPEEKPADSPAPDNADRIVFLGFHYGAEALLNHLARTRPELLARMTIIDFNPEILRELQRLPVRPVFGDLTSPDTLEHAGVAEAAVIISTIPDVLLRGTSNLELVHTCRRIAPRAQIVATADTELQADALRAAGAELVTVPYRLMAHQIGELLARVLPPS